MDYRALVNPTHSTAKTTAIALSNAGNTDARQMIDDLNIVSSMDISEKESSAIAARYATVSKILEEGIWKNLLDIGCGYSPRFLFCERAGIHYVGMDLPIIAEDLQKFASASEAKHSVFVGGDATNAATLLRAADMLDGELLVSCEGLLHYMTEDEADHLIGGIQKVLSRHGGAWITSDFTSAPFDVHDDLYENALPLWSEDKKLAFLEIHGMMTEKFLASDDAAAMWKMTADPAFVGVQQGVRQLENLTIDYRLGGTKMFFMIQGRIDSVSAPALLSIYDRVGNEVTSVTIDGTNLAYISSAGLRTLLMMAKKGPVKIIGATETVKDIMKTTGFDQILTVK